MTTREQAIEMAKKAGFDAVLLRYASNTPNLRRVERLIAIATNAAIERAANAIKSRQSAESSECAMIILALKVQE